MGAAAGKQFQNEKGKHAAAILSAVQSFDETHGVSDVENNPELFKRRVLLAAADAKKNGKDIENSLAQLTDADFETLCQYVGNQKDNSAFANKSASMKIEEIIDDEVANAAADNIDETTSVLSYGDDEEEAVEHESEVETSMNSNTLAARRLKPHNSSRQSNISREDDNDSSGDELSIAEIPTVHKKDSAASANGGYKVFPLSAAQSVDSPAGSGKYRKQPRSAELVAKEEQQLMEQDEALLPSSKFRTPTQHQRAKDTPTKHSSHHAGAGTPSSLLMPGMLPAGVAEKYSRIWDLDGSDLVASSLSSQHGFDSPAAKQYSSPSVHRKGPSPSGFGATSSHQKAGRQTNSTGGDGKTLLYKDMGERIDERNEALMGLQRKKVISYTQNAQLEREVEALQRQLEKMEQLDRETGSKLAGSSPSTIYGHSNTNLSGISSPLHLVLSPPGAVHHRVNLHDSHQSSRPAPGSAGGSRFSSIYPIDEESPQSRHGSGNRAVHNDSSSRSNNVHSEFKHSGYAGGESKGHRHQPRQHHKHGSSSSSDTDNSSAQHSHPVDMQRAADDKRPARFGRFSEEKEQEEIGSTVHKTNISPLHTAQQQPRHVPRRRVRTGMGALGAHGVSGNSSGVESDDSASFQPHRHIRSVQSKQPGSDPHEVVTNNEKAEWNSATTVEQPREREKQQHSVARRERARTNSNFESESASKHTGAARSGIPGPSRIYGAQSEDEFEAAAPPSHAKQLRSGAGHHRGRRMTSEETSPSKLNSVAVEASSNPIEEGYSSGNAGRSGQTRGGALRKLNKRRHSLDGKDDPQLHLHLHQEDGGGAAEDEEVALPIKESSVLQQRAAGRPRRIGAGAVIHPSEPDSSKVTVSPATSLKVHQQRGRHVDGAERTERVEKVEKVEYSPSASKETKETAKEAGSSEHIVNGAQATVAKKRRNRVTSLSGNKPQITAAVQDASAQDSDGPPPLWTPALDNSWAEVSLLLRKPIKTEQDMLYSVAAAEAGIIFTDQMNIICKSINVLRGALSRWLLPFDNNTRIDSQCSTPHSVVENMPEEFRGKLTERQVHYLVAGANGVRRLVRIKIADDNDLEQARTALITADSFFKALYRAAESAGMSPFQLLQANL